MLLEQVQTPRNAPNVIQPSEHCDNYFFFLPIGFSKSSLIFFANKRKPRIAKVNSRKYLNLTYSTIQKLKRSRTASWLLKFELCISQVFSRKTSDIRNASRKAPQCAAAFISAPPCRVFFPPAERRRKAPPNSQWGGNDLNRGGRFSWNTPINVSVEYGHLIKTQKHC